MWSLGRIWIYPIKSLPGIEVSQSVLLPAGNLEFDRELALVDESGRFMNAKRTAEIHRIRASWDLVNRTVTLSTGTTSSSIFQLDSDREQLGEWMSDFFQTPIHVEQRSSGFPDDLEASGPTIVSTATLNAVASWFPGLEVDEVRRRFRANLELTGGEPFGEDAFYGPAGMLTPLQIGEARLFGSNPCQRCVVPTRDSATGEIWPGFQKEFAKRREASLPSWADRSRLNHFYRLSVNTVVKHAERQHVQVGDAVRVVD